jgi:hypothetical protein
MNQKVVIYIILSAILLYLYYRKKDFTIFVAFAVVAGATLIFRDLTVNEGLTSNEEDDKKKKKNVDKKNADKKNADKKNADKKNADKKNADKKNADNNKKKKSDDDEDAADEDE